MKQNNMQIRWIALVVTFCTLTSVCGFLLRRGDIRFLLVKAFHSPSQPALSETTWQNEAMTEWTLSALLSDVRVTASTSLLLVNASHPLPTDYQAELTEYNGARMHPLMVEPYTRLRDAVQAQTGVRIYVSSDYRTPEEQKEIISESEAGIAAPLGCSEHEAGLALDVYAPHFGGKAFLRSPAGRMVNQICENFGFIIRYDLGKESITGISYEPWHIRYVGEPHARLIMDSGVSLEEYLEALTPEVWFAYEDYRILRTSSETVELPQSWSALDVSPDNMGYFILTLKI